ncbi:hypothetical protein UA74_17205 [Actinoalloteichus fjordicus]|uniref:Uncharacterized protein n=1 Tax=Actinoalloteichus fjordicus TaxID=1612552 RepID=A0AAC9PT40_9PSEU|nr:hypothetical protein UA74_17205 [Actinoalloteichus fjordicus]
MAVVGPGHLGPAPPRSRRRDAGRRTRLRREWAAAWSNRVSAAVPIPASRPVRADPGKSGDHGGGRLGRRQNQCGGAADGGLLRHRRFHAVSSETAVAARARSSGPSASRPSASRSVLRRSSPGRSPSRPMPSGAASHRREGRRPPPASPPRRSTPSPAAVTVTVQVVGRRGRPVPEESDRQGLLPARGRRRTVRAHSRSGPVAVTTDSSHRNDGEPCPPTPDPPTPPSSASS